MEKNQTVFRVIIKWKAINILSLIEIYIFHMNFKN